MHTWSRQHIPPLVEGDTYCSHAWGHRDKVLPTVSMLFQGLWARKEGNGVEVKEKERNSHILRTFTLFYVDSSATMENVNREMPTKVVQYRQSSQP